MKNYQQTVKQRRIKLEKAKTLRANLRKYKPVINNKNRAELIFDKVWPTFSDPIIDWPGSVY